MAKRYDLPRIPATEEPTIWNRTMGVWAFVGSWVAAIAAHVGLAATGIDADLDPVFDLHGAHPETTAEAVKELQPVLNTIGGTNLAIESATGVAAVAGGLSGKAKMERELQTGKVVKDPTFWNGGIVSGIMAVSVPAGVAVASLFLVGAPLLGVAVAAAGFVASLGAAIYGGFAVKGKMQQEFNQSLAIKEEIELQRGYGKCPVMAQQHAYVNSVTPEESQALEAAQGRGVDSGKSFVQALDEARHLSSVPQLG